MENEAYKVGYDRKNYHAPIPKGEDKENVQKIRKDGIVDNMLRYLGEYRLGVKFDEIFYRQETDLVTGEIYLASGERCPIRNRFRKTIDMREKKGLSVEREVAECLGFEKLEKKLVNSSDNSLFIWVSPPGSRKDGYGDYSFTFIGQKLKDPKTEHETIRVIPYRNILSLSEHKAYLKKFDKEAEYFNSAIDFLSNPIIFSKTKDIETPEKILHIIGEHERVSTGWFVRLKKEVGSLIERYIDLVKVGVSDTELTKVKYAIENYTINIKHTLEGNFKNVNEGTVSIYDLDRTIGVWGRHEPPKVGGSCGTSSSSTLMENHEKSNKAWEYHTGDCVNCGVKGVDVGPCDICKKCEKKFDEQEENF